MPEKIARPRKIARRAECAVHLTPSQDFCQRLSCNVSVVRAFQEAHDCRGNDWVAYGPASRYPAESLFNVKGIDGRSVTARRFRDLVEIMTNDLSGPDTLSEGQRQMIRRAASLSIMAESVEANMARDLDFDVNVYGMVTDRLRRVIETLGLPRVAKEIDHGPLVNHLSRALEPLHLPLPSSGWLMRILLAAPPIWSGGYYVYGAQMRGISRPSAFSEPC